MKLGLPDPRERDPPVPRQLPARVFGQFVFRNACQHGGPAGGEPRGPDKHHARVHGGAGVCRHLQRREPGTVGYLQEAPGVGACAGIEGAALGASLGYGGCCRCSDAVPWSSPPSALLSPSYRRGSQCAEKGGDLSKAAVREGDPGVTNLISQLHPNVYHGLLPLQNG